MTFMRPATGRAPRTCRSTIRDAVHFMGHADNTMLRQIYDQTDEAGNVRAARERYARDHTAPAPAKPKG